jgi:hypothetical protein
VICNDGKVAVKRHFHVSLTVNVYSQSLLYAYHASHSLLLKNSAALIRNQILNPSAGRVQRKMRETNFCTDPIKRHANICAVSGWILCLLLWRVNEKKNDQVRFFMTLAALSDVNTNKRLFFFTSDEN